MRRRGEMEVDEKEEEEVVEEDTEKDWATRDFMMRR